MLAATLVAKKKSSSPFGSRLKSLREQAGLTQTQLGERADMLYQVVARLERGDREPTWPTVLKLAAALGVSTAAFEADSDQPDDEPEPPQRPTGKRK